MFLFDCYFGGGQRRQREIWTINLGVSGDVPVVTQKIGSLEHMMLMITMMRIREPVKNCFSVKPLRGGGYLASSFKNIAIGIHNSIGNHDCYYNDDGGVVLFEK